MIIPEDIKMNIAESCIPLGLTHKVLFAHYDVVVVVSCCSVVVSANSVVVVGQPSLSGNATDKFML